MFTRNTLCTICLLGCTAAALAQPLGTAFTYQAELRSSGAPASGLYDLRFRLYDAASAGTQVGSTLCADNLTLTSGRFTIDLDFGAVFAGQQRFLEIDVRADAGLGCANATGFTTLAPRQPLTAAPNAAFALNAATASSAATAAFLAFSGKVFAAGALDAKAKQIIAVAVAHVTQCQQCIRSHTKSALRAGATPQELMEAAWVAAEMRAGGAYAHSNVMLAAINEEQSTQGDQEGRS